MDGASSSRAYVPPFRRETPIVTDPYGDGSMYVPVRNTHGFMRNVIKELDKYELEQFAEYTSTCTMCGEPFYGILDESKITLPIGNLVGYFSQGGRGSREFWSDRDLNDGRTVHNQGMYSAYYVRHMIVRSGMYTRDQLSPWRFTNHELDVNDRSFRDIRPRRCGCDFGPWEDLDEASREALVACGYAPTEMAVESEFILGRPVPTGRRRRSKSALSARRTRRRLCAKSRAPATLVATPRGRPRTVNPPRRRKSHRYYGRPTAKRSYKPRFVDVGRHSPNIGWYYHRTRGFYYPSQHHPLR
jgi:hypothetical protein